MKILVQETAPGRWMSVIFPSLLSLGYQDMCTCWLQPWLPGDLMLILQTLGSPMESLEPSTTSGHSAHIYLITVRPEIAQPPILGLNILSWCHWGNDGIIKKNGEIEKELLWAIMWRIQHGAHSLLKSRMKHPTAGCVWGSPQVSNRGEEHVTAAKERAGDSRTTVTEK